MDVPFSKSCLGDRSDVASVHGSSAGAPTARCVALSNMPANRLMTLQVYPGAYHSFDVPGMRSHCELGHMLGYDAAATADAHARVQAFLYQYLH
jgi:dienelactone hydrolase